MVDDNIILLLPDLFPYSTWRQELEIRYYNIMTLGDNKNKVGTVLNSMPLTEARMMSPVMNVGELNLS